MRQLSRRQTFDVAVGGVVLAILGALALGVALAPGRSETSGSATVPRVRLDVPGEEARLRVPYSDGVFLLSDERHVPGAGDVPRGLQRAVVGGGPGVATVLACCSIGDAPTTIALRADVPPAPAWTQSAETDLDLPSGHLALSSTDGVLAIAELPRGAYRLRVSGRGAREFQQRRERFLIELWRRRG